MQILTTTGQKILFANDVALVFEDLEPEDYLKILQLAGEKSAVVKMQRTG